jgi:hypothetical protein
MMFGAGLARSVPHLKRFFHGRLFKQQVVARGTSADRNLDPIRRCRDRRRNQRVRYRISRPAPPALVLAQASTLRPFIGQLERAAGFARDDATATKLDKLEALLAKAPESGDIWLIAEMLSLPAGDRFPTLDLTPQRKKERTLEALPRQFQARPATPSEVKFAADLYGAFPVKRLFWVVLTVFCSERERPFFVPSPAIRFPERAEGVKGPKR